MHYDFNSHTREGVTHWTFAIDAYFGNFNSHTREGVTQLHRGGHNGDNFNSHTREGVTSRVLQMAEDKKISTHTPVRV